MEELQIELNNLKKEVLELKELIINNFKEQSTVINNIENMLNDDVNVKQNIDFGKLEKGFNLEKSFIRTCLNKNNIIGEIDLFKQYYLRNDIIIPIKKTGQQLEYYNKKWILNQENFIEDTILLNIINTYLELMQSEDNDYNEWADFKSEPITNRSSLKYIRYLQENKKHRKSIINEILVLI
tara:strand:- start:755 stop:1300 length:546 start_codon:yes stop_codon:yes gene_type:complete